MTLQTDRQRRSAVGDPKLMGILFGWLLEADWRSDLLCFTADIATAASGSQKGEHSVIAQSN